MLKNSNLVKIQTYCPEKYADKLRLAIGSVNIDAFDNYSHCVFVSSGYGYFQPLDNSCPAIGEINKINKVKELKIEFICKKSKLKKIIQIIKENHPYEEVAIDILAMYDI